MEGHSCWLRTGTWGWKLDNRRLEKCCPSWWVWIFAVGFKLRNGYKQTDPSYFILTDGCFQLTLPHHDTKLRYSQTGFLNMTVRSMYSNGLCSYHIFSRARWDVVEQSWMMWRHQICSNLYDAVMSTSTKISKICFQLNLCHSVPNKALVSVHLV